MIAIAIAKAFVVGRYTEYGKTGFATLTPDRRLPRSVDPRGHEQGRAGTPRKDSKSSTSVCRRMQANKCANIASNKKVCYPPTYLSTYPHTYLPTHIPIYLPTYLTI